MVVRVLLLAATIAAATAACTATPSTTSQSSSSTDDASSDALVSCEGDPRVDTYVANLAKTAKDGAMKVTLVAATPAPPARGTNTWTVRVTDGSGAPITNAPLAVTPFMPDHGHGSQVVPTVAPGADGTYTIGSIVLFMPGVWRITIAAPLSEASTDQVQFFFCIEG